MTEAGTPYFRISPPAVRERVQQFQACFPGATILYPMKCNPHPAVLDAVRAAGGGFEVASLPEMRTALALGVPSGLVLFGAPVKSPATISTAYEAGVRTFVADSADEIDRIAGAAPGAGVYLRLAFDDPTSMVPLSSKFGAPPAELPALARRARDAGLMPAAVMFHVGSQATDAGAWARALDQVLGALTVMADEIAIPIVDLGGGFPHPYLDSVPAVAEIAAHVDRALERAPYPIRLVLEPGRALVAGCATLVTSVIARVTRNGEEWLFLDAGIYSGLCEAALPGAQVRFPVRLADRAPRTGRLGTFTLTGPTCDSIDVVARGVDLPDCLGAGDRLEFDGVGAYSLSLVTNFNGFAAPEVVIDEVAHEPH